MHLKPAKYKTLEVSGSRIADGSSVARSPMLLFDGGNGSGNGSNNNNHHKQFTASGQFYTPSSAINGKLNNKGPQNTGLSNENGFSKLESWSINYNNTNHNDGSNMNLYSNTDKTKLMEQSIINLVKMSTLAAEEKKLELALERAKGALEGLNSLKAALVQEKSSSISPFNYNNNNNNGSTYNASQPMTKGASLFELTLMVNSNLAAQFKNNGHLDESIELYTQLCKTANSVSTSISSSLQYDAKFILFRFGLNIGNILYEMNDYQRALKYYRLTLDRLSSSGHRNLKIKLMNNIALTLMAMKQRQQTETITSLNLLLADNLSQVKENNKLSDIYNSNHHKFGLSLMVCYYQRGDLTSMMGTLKDLVRADICHQYDRVFDLNLNMNVNRKKKDDNFNKETQDNEGRNSSNSTAAFSTDLESSAHATERNRLLIGQFDKREIHTETNDGGEIVKAGGPLIRQASSLSTTQSQRQITNKQGDLTSDRDSEHTSSGHSSGELALPTATIGDLNDDGTGTGTASFLGETDIKLKLANHELVKGTVRLTKLSDDEKARQVMRIIQEDRLEKLIGEKHSQISRSLIMACNLMLELENRFRPNNGNGISVFQFCLNLLSTSETYKNLVCDLKTNNVRGMLIENHSKLDEAIAVLKGIEIEQQVDLKGRDNMTKLIANKYNTILSKSSIVATNMCLLYMLQNDTKKAIQYAEHALKLDKFNVHTWVNLANCHYQLNNFKLAETFYQRALSIAPSCWEANYNLALVNRKLDSHYNELNSFTKSSLNKHRQCFNTSLYQKMMLPVIQLALIYQQSGRYQQSREIFNDLIINSRQAPEVHLLASRLMEDNGEDSIKTSAMSILQHANREYPYYLPIVERLIALNIKNFDYATAEVLLISCIRNRPDQVKWYQMLAECQRRAAEYNRAIATYKIAIDSFPQDTSCLKALIKLSDELGLVDEKKSYEVTLERALKRSVL